MPRLPRRERWSIIGAILEAVESQNGEHGGGARVTNVALRANIAHDRLIEYLAELAEAGLVTTDKMPRLTPKGHQFLREYQQWMSVLGRFGLD